jgi:hypothetical protein
MNIGYGAPLAAAFCALGPSAPALSDRPRQRLPDQQLPPVGTA